MSSLSAFFSLETKRFFSKRNMFILFLVLFLSLYFINVGINEYKNIINKAEKFKNLEALNFQKFKFYSYYGDEGINFLFFPSPAGILFKNSCVSSDLYANVDSIVSLRIFSNHKGKSLFSANYSVTWDFSMIILIFGSILVMFFGHDAFHNKEYIKFLSSIFNHRKVFLSVFISRLILTILSLLTLLLFMLGFIRIHNIKFGDGDYTSIGGFILSSLIIMLFFFLVGCLMGFVRSKTVGIIAILVIWSVLTFLIPGFIQTIVEENSIESTSDYQTEIEKIRIENEFEKRCEEKAGKFNRGNMEMEKQFVEEYWKEDYKRIEALEEGLKGEIEGNIDRYRKLAVFTPVTFYQMTGNEVSSRGYENFLEFYAYLQEMKRKFVRFYIDRVYYNDPRELVSFIKGDENIYYAKSRLPENFWIGVLINLFYIAILMLLSYFQFGRYLFDTGNKEYKELKELNLKLRKGKTVVLLSLEKNLQGQLFKFLSGEARDFDGSLRLNDVNIAEKERQSQIAKDFIYVCHADNIPEEIKVNDFIRFIGRLLNLSGQEMAQLYIDLNMDHFKGKSFGQVDEGEKGDVLFTLARVPKRGIMVIQDFLKNMPVPFIIDFRDELIKLKEENTAVLYATNDFLLAAKICNFIAYIMTDPTLPKHLETYKAFKDHDNME